jgi:hypothetical protein
MLPAAQAMHCSDMHKSSRGQNAKIEPTQQHAQHCRASLCSACKLLEVTSTDRAAEAAAKRTIRDIQIRGAILAQKSSKRMLFGLVFLEATGWSDNPDISTTQREHNLLSTPLESADANLSMFQKRVYHN